MRPMMSWTLPLLRVPLAWKLAGANVLIALVAIGADASGHRSTGDATWTPVITGVAITAALLMNFVLVRIALRPLWQLEATVRRVSRGDFDSRVPPSPLADWDMSRVASMVNLLLDTVSNDRLRRRQLTSQVIDKGDRQRAAVAHELHDSAAQTLSALSMQIAAAAREETSPAMIARLISLRDMVAGVTEEIRQLAHEIHPRVLEDLGLPAALRELAREAAGGPTTIVRVFAPGNTLPIPPATAIPLYWVAREALTNALRHAKPSQVNIHLTTEDARATLLVEDDGPGFDVARAERSQNGTGLFAMRERASLAKGSFEIRSAPGTGTTVSVQAPMFTSCESVLAELLP